MSVSVRIPPPLRPLVGDVTSVECAPGTVRELIAELESRYAGFAARVTEDGALRRFVNVFVGGQDVRFAEGIDTPVPDWEEVTILPAVAGGAVASATRPDRWRWAG
jgi:molybdopterin synthase sulfur carrier subunit